MLNNIPIWLQEDIIKSIEGFIALSYFTYLVVIIYLIQCFTTLFKTRNLKRSFRKKSISIMIILLLVSVVSQYYFFKTETLSFDDYKINSFSVRYYDERNKVIDIKITKPEVINELLSIFEGAQIKRILRGNVRDYPQVDRVYIDFHGKSSKIDRPFHFIILKEYIKLYESGNISFMYEVNGNVAAMFNEIQELIMNIK